MLRRQWLLPWLLMAPGLLWLGVFFVLPSVQMLAMSLSEGSLESGFQFTFNVGNYLNLLDPAEGLYDNYRNSLLYGGLSTFLTFLIGYPLAYGIAFRGGRYKTILLFLVIAPFFTNFLIRTISWRIILAENGPVIGALHGTGLVPRNFGVINTPLAVVSGLTYQFLPFMVLPVYVALEKIDLRLVEAAKDLYAGPWRRGGAIVGTIAGILVPIVVLAVLGYLSLDPGALLGLLPVAIIGGLVGGLIGAFLISESFLRVIFPLSLPGVFAGSILTFIPAIGDYVNAELLGNPRSQMVGNVIQSRFIDQNEYPSAAALSFVLLVGILAAIVVYARLLGTEELSGGVA